MGFLEEKENRLHANGDILWDKVQLSDLPKMSELNIKVQAVLDQTSWLDKYGREWLDIAICFVLVFLSLYMMSLPSPWLFTIGLFIHGTCHSMLSVRIAHATVHGSLCQSKWVNKICSYFFGDVCGSFSGDLGYDMHIKGHHPHTNIIGLGDSSTWKIPLLPSYVYMYLSPLLLPLVTIPVVLSELWGQWFKLLRYLSLALIGIYVNIWLFINVAKISSFANALLCVWASRAMLAIPYIHVNIFQHIGLPMYSQEHRPVRIYQMSTGVLNLPRNLVLDWAFGYSINSCHIEHHLFPKLSDHMCLKIQPIVSQFLKKSSLPYNYDSYWNRMILFTKSYEKLMVNAPPITHFVGIQ